MARPAELALRLGWYIFKNKVKGRKRYPLVTMLEPLEACEGCGRIREYEPVIDKQLTVEQCIAAVEESGAPIVSIAGGERPYTLRSTTSSTRSASARSSSTCAPTRLSWSV